VADEKALTRGQCCDPHPSSAAKRYDGKAPSANPAGAELPILLLTFGIPAIVAGVIQWNVL